MNKYKVLSIILSVVSVVSIGGMLYFALGNTKEEPKSKEVTTTSTESTTTTSTTESESTTKVSEVQQGVTQPATTVISGKSYPLDDRGRISGEAQQELLAKHHATTVRPLAPPSTIASTYQPVVTTEQLVGDHNPEIRAYRMQRYADIARQKKEFGEDNWR